MGRFIVADGVNPPTTNIKVDTIDPILPDEGALILLDPAHPSQQWDAGVPAHGATLPNLVEDQALDVFPSLAEANVRPLMALGSSFGTTNALAERTTKGGLHLARAATTGDANTFALLYMPDVFARSTDGLSGAMSDDYFISFWGQVTKAYASDITQIPGHSHLHTASTPGNGYRFSTRRTTGDPQIPLTADARRIEARAYGAIDTATTLGPLLQNVGISSITGALSVSGTQYILQVGNLGIVDGDRGKNASFVFYRYYMENLTVSGRTYAEVDAIDNAMFTADVLTAGGRYYGDEFTDPASIAA